MFITINNIWAIEDFSSGRYENEKPKKVNINKTKIIINITQISNISASYNYMYEYTRITNIDDRHYLPKTVHGIVDLKIQVRTIKMSNGDMFTIADDEFKKIIPLLSQEC